MYHRPPVDALVQTLVVEHRSAVLDYTRRLTRGDSGWAEDVVQETYLRAWRRWERMTPEHGSVRTWLIRVAHNLVVDGYRTARMRRGELPLHEAGEVDEISLPEQTDQILTACLVHQALHGLPEQHRRALEATYLKDQTAAQAADELNIPVGTVKSRVHYGLRMLRASLQVETPAAA